MVKLKSVRLEKTLLWLWLVSNLAIGILTVHRYGMSVDEPNNHRYANDTIEAYTSLFSDLHEPKYDSSYDGHGPAFITMAGMLIRSIQAVFPGTDEPDLWHFSYFVTFQLTGLCLYWLTKRWFSNWTAWGNLLLFTTQPLLWGHAFINPKDIPFMFFFTLSILLGFRLVDSAEAQESFISLERPIKALTNKSREQELTGKQGNQPSSLEALADFFHALLNRHTLLAGIALGLATAVRSIAPLAGVMVFLYLLFKVRSRAWPTAIGYFLVTGVSMYLTWPFLWKAPIANFFASLKTSSSFPYRGTVLFMGNIYPTNQLPRRFFPTLLGLQLTEPALILIAIGFVISLYLFIKGKNREPLLLFAIWFLLPAFWLVLSRSVSYDNARQLLFLWPALFLLAGAGIEQLLALVKLPLWRLGLIIAITLHGTYASIQLHPYQYIYYNSLIGGVRGAYRNFELDYWAISFRESMEYLNKNAEPGSTIMVIGPSRQIAREYARPDLTVIVLKRVGKSETQPYYILSSTRSNDDISHCRNAAVVSIVERDGGILSYVKKIDPGQNCK